jgi:hypothetical protein
MGKNKLSRNAKCPCGTGRKYKACCYAKGFRYLVDEDGNVSRAVPLNDEVMALLDCARQRFIEKHGREPGPDDPVFEGLPPEADTTADMVASMRKIGISPALIYAYEKTGLILTEQNRHFMPTADVEAFEAACEEWYAEHEEPVADA